MALRPEITALTPYRQGKPAAADAFKLSSNENPYPTHPRILAAIAASSPNRYPDASARILSERLAARHGVALDEVLVGAGSVSLLYQLVQAAAGPGDEVVFPWRSFEAYPGIVTLSGATAVPVPNLPDHSHDLDAMAEAITPRTRAVILCSPNNPTGAAIDRGQFEAFMARIPESLLVILDEAYYEFNDLPDAVDGMAVRGRYPNLAVLRTFSKAFGLAGLRIGYGVAESYILDAARSSGIPLSVTEQAQVAASVALDVEAELLEQVAVLRRRRDEVWAALRALGLEVPRPFGNFVWLALGEHTAAGAELFDRHGIVVRAFPPEGLRISIGEPESVAPLLRAAEELVETLSLPTATARLG